MLANLLASECDEFIEHLILTTILLCGKKLRCFAYEDYSNGNKSTSIVWITRRPRNFSIMHTLALLKSELTDFPIWPRLDDLRTIYGSVSHCIIPGTAEGFHWKRSKTMFLKLLGLHIDENMLLLIKGWFTSPVRNSHGHDAYRGVPLQKAATPVSFDTHPRERGPRTISLPVVMRAHPRPGAWCSSAGTMP